MSLDSKLRNIIDQQGFISVAQFMSLALGDESYGYYKTQQPFGLKGDFITSPDISQMFGEMLGVWCASMWQVMGCPPALSLVELGPGKGVMMADMLRATRHIDGFHQALSISLVESSAKLRKVQQEQLQAYASKVNWYDDISLLPELPTLLVSNEFFDALPIHQFVYQNGQWFERVIMCTDKGFEFTLKRSNEVTSYTKQLQLPQDANDKELWLEVNNEAQHITKALASHIHSYGGAMLTIDYGYDAEFGVDTLQALKNHKYHPILEDVGSADITAHVNFKHLATIAREQGLKVGPTITQGDFLLRMGIEQRATMLRSKADHLQQSNIDSALTRLTHHDEMGALFKVSVFASQNITMIVGF